MEQSGQSYIGSLVSALSVWRRRGFDVFPAMPDDRAQFILQPFIFNLLDELLSRGRDVELGGDNGLLRLLPPSLINEIVNAGADIINTVGREDIDLHFSALARDSIPFDLQPDVDPYRSILPSDFLLELPVN